MLRPYTYHFVFTIHLKTGETILLDDERQQIHLLTEEEAKENSVEKDFTDPTEAGGYCVHVGKKTIKYYDTFLSWMIKVKKDEFDHIHMSRQAEIVKTNLKRLYKECDSERVLQYIKERLIEGLELEVV